MVSPISAPFSPGASASTVADSVPPQKTERPRNGLVTPGAHRSDQATRQSPESGKNEHLNMAYRHEIQSVANKMNAVIMIRDPNFKGQSLMRDGHATKSSHIKAKSSETGPTAGFVAVEPRYTKASQSEGKQAAAVRDSFAHGCRAQQIFLTPSRVMELARTRDLNPKSPALPGGKPDIKLLQDRTSRDAQGDVCGGKMIISANYPHRGEVEFELEYDAREKAFAVYEIGNKFHRAKEPKPVMGLTNPPTAEAHKKPASRFDAVCADYDLFGVFPGRRQDSATDSRQATEPEPNGAALKPDSQRYFAVPPRPVVPHSPAIRSRITTLSENVLPVPEREPEGILNATPLVERAMQNLNAEIKQAGGTQVIFHHSDELGNPTSDHPGFPQFAIIPDHAAGSFTGKFARAESGQPVALESWDDLFDFNQQLEKAGFAPEGNNARWIAPTAAGQKTQINEKRGEPVLLMKQVEDLLQGTQEGSLQRFSALRKGIASVNKTIDDALIVKKPEALTLSKVEKAGQVIFENKIAPRLKENGFSGDLATFKDEMIDRLGQMTPADAVAFKAKINALFNVSSPQGNARVKAFRAKAEMAQTHSRQIVQVATTLALIIGEVQRQSLAEAQKDPFGPQIAAAFRGALDNAVERLLEKVDSLQVDTWAQTRDARDAVVELASLYGVARQDMRSLEDDLQSMLADGFKMTDERHSDSRDLRHFKKRFKTDFKAAATAQIKTTKAKARDLINVSEQLFHFEHGKHKPLPISSDQVYRASAGEAENSLGAVMHDSKLKDDLRGKLDRALGQFGFAVPDGIFDDKGEVISEKKAVDFRDTIDAFGKVMLGRARPTVSLDRLVQVSNARMDRHIKRTTETPKAAELLFLLGLDRHSSDSSAKNAAKGLVPVAEMRARLSRAAEKVPDQFPLEIASRDFSEAAKSESQIRQDWQAVVKHIVETTKAEALLNVSVSVDEIRKVPTYLGKLFGQTQPHMEKAERDRNEEKLTIQALLDKYKTASRKLGLTSTLPQKQIDRLLSQTPARDGVAAKQAEKDIKALRDHTGKKSTMGKVLHAVHSAFEHTLKPADSQARVRGLYAPAASGTAAGVNLYNISEHRAPNGPGFDGEQLDGFGIARAVSTTFSVVNSLYGARDGINEHSPLGSQQRDRAIIEQKELGKEMVGRYLERPGLENRMRSRVLLHLGEKIQGKADRTAFESFDGKLGFATDLASAAISTLNAGRLTTDAALKLANVTVPAAVGAAGAASILWAGLNTAYTAGKQGYQVGQARRFAKVNETALAAALAAGKVAQSDDDVFVDAKSELPDADLSAAMDLIQQDRRQKGEGAVELAHSALAKRNRVGRATLEMAETTINAGTLTSVAGILWATGAVTATLSAGIGFGALAALTAGSFAFRAGLQAKRDATRDALTDFLKDAATPAQIARLQAKAGMSEQGSEIELKSEAVREIIRREPELITDTLLSSLRREMPALGAEESRQQAERLEAMQVLHQRRDALEGLDRPMSEAEQQELSDCKEAHERLENAVNQQALLRIGSSKTAAFLAGLGVEPIHLLAIADSYQDKAHDALCRELLNFTVLKVARLDDVLRGGNYSR